MTESLVLDPAAIQEEKLLCSRRTGTFRMSKNAPDSEPLTLRFNRDHPTSKLLTEQGSKALQKRSRGNIQNERTLIRQHKAHGQMPQHKARDRIGYEAEFGHIGTKEFPTSRDIVEKVTHQYLGSYLAGVRLNPGFCLWLGKQAPSYRLLGPAGTDLQLRNSCNGSQRLPTKAQSPNPMEILHTTDLACGMAPNAER